ncbi:CRISPR-associated endonuclease Cas2 [Rhodospirillum rubrum]|uniref:CRISPR-associated endoribonuclease Cas2 4 n=1 Tax=Rhodospirillum rubrum (strain ATCC 11170 / ATH 1.1.1 / DSM 467 / LMG 4362 / NCIMB 8255 / S1) TaxID=269796 RepID=CAS2D_RHORT|nr:CRISPR-associated endonuclease Cas2 [Rhodospirillum rubrum]Q2RV91.1 RecName: Full=CRISPR-associated endoribonuclease Cas2 4 [Rhodospirillum rubrum ATCC 11170]ABC21954.1 CRISPR-associated protein, Cas2 family [Rhodospirillum rubrum ATCC 11170]AEO47659.1 CRISPR-associated Cas2 family protein [Rhodospirillum rubrum F11]MBK5953520.1 CRISPR-associated endonuclease Cas2 [Rhodospirillum rubrum]QXG81607.1 CRISPR-associated endonuclease Cas2 [Rhodospirillum rubrum]HAQ00715.1 CRISPR-associated endon
MVWWDDPDDAFCEDPFDPEGDYGALQVGKQPMNRYVICYDIVDDKRRLKVAKCLDSYGSRVQFSVFEVLVSKPLMTRMVRELGALINAKTDRISIYPQCATCDARRTDLGATVEKPVHEPWIIV